MEEGNWLWVGETTKWHYFVDGRSLCGMRMVKGPEDYELIGQDDNPDNCKLCRRKLDALRKDRQEGTKEKAYVVTSADEEYSDVVFASSPGQAKMQSDLDFDDYIDLHVKRRPDFDKYASEGRVPDQVLLEDGWWLRCRCSVCDRLVAAMDDYDPEDVRIYPYIEYDEHGMIRFFICSDCLSRRTP